VAAVLQNEQLDAFIFLLRNPFLIGEHLPASADNFS